MLRRFVIFDYANRGTFVETKEKPIDFIVVNVVSGDETGTIFYKDGTCQHFDSCDCRTVDFLDDTYILRGRMIDKWAKYIPAITSNFTMISSLRAFEFGYPEEEN